MSQVLSYDSLVKCASGLVVITVLTVVAAETEILPSQIRHPLRVAVHDTLDRVTRVPAVRDILRTFH
jgi:hypothetical protein